MQTQSLLSLIQKHYDFKRANQILSQPNLKNSWKHWLCCELLSCFNQISDQWKIVEETSYRDKDQAKEQDKDKGYLKYKTGDKDAKPCDKRSASKSDISLTLAERQYHLELRCAHQDYLFKGKELHKFADDLERIDKLKQANPELNIAALFAFYGQFSTQDVQTLSMLDNSKYATYVLDSSLTGSTSIARLSHMKREGNPRVILVGYLV